MAVRVSSHWKAPAPGVGGVGRELLAIVAAAHRAVVVLQEETVKVSRMPVEAVAVRTEGAAAAGGGILPHQHSVVMAGGALAGRGEQADEHRGGAERVGEMAQELAAGANGVIGSAARQAPGCAPRRRAGDPVGRR